MTGNTFFWDTYALMEAVNGNPKFEKYFHLMSVTSDLNLMEFYYHLLKSTTPENAFRHIQEWAFFSKRIPLALMKQAMEFRFQNRREKLSYVDCMGYVFAVAHGMKFLTGDKQFEGKPHVEFVK